MNRLAALRRCIQNIQANVSVSHELIIVEGGSIDGTCEFLARHSGLRIIHEARRQGAVQARNKGFRAARGRYVMWLDDRAYPLRGSVEAAITSLERSSDAVMVGFYDDRDCGRIIRESVQRDDRCYRIYDVKGCPFAHYGLLPRIALTDIVAADAGLIRPRHDAQISLRLQREFGVRIMGCRDALVHYQPLTEPERPTPSVPVIRPRQSERIDGKRVFADETLAGPLEQQLPDKLQLA